MNRAGVFAIALSATACVACQVIAEPPSARLGVELLDDDTLLITSVACGDMIHRAEVRRVEDPLPDRSTDNPLVWSVEGSLGSHVRVEMSHLGWVEDARSFPYEFRIESAINSGSSGLEPKELSPSTAVFQNDTIPVAALHALKCYPHP
jgi:hypothetical protein